MIEQLVLFGACLSVWGFFRITSGQQRRRALTIALWVILSFGAVGFLAEVVMRGGALPITG
jgi:hypothetical protein